MAGEGYEGANSDEKTNKDGRRGARVEEGRWRMGDGAGERELSVGEEHSASAAITRGPSNPLLGRSPSLSRSHLHLPALTARAEQVNTPRKNTILKTATETTK